MKRCFDTLLLCSGYAATAAVACIYLGMWYVAFLLARELWFGILP